MAGLSTSDRVTQNDCTGQASVELVAVLPLVVVAVALLVQAVFAGWTFWSVGVAAETGARHAYLGRDAEVAARASLPAPLSASAKVRTSGRGAVRVGARPPSLLPGFATPRLWATAAAGKGGG